MPNNSSINSNEIIKFLKKSGLEIETRNFCEKMISNIETDSRKVTTNSLFICIPGLITDGHNFAEDAIANGAAVLVVERFLPLSIFQIKVQNARIATAWLAQLFYHDPSANFKLIGITGTNGKTTVTDIIFQLLRNKGARVGKIGTLGYSINEKNFKTNHTTPDILELNQILKKMVREKVEYVVMEVSSHAIALHRTFGLKFDLALLTNISQDHLDFHGNMQNYAETKFRFLKQVLNQNQPVLVNIDDEFGNKFAQKYPARTISFGKADYSINLQQISSQHSKFKLNNIDFTTQLIGKHNVFNLAAAIIAVEIISNKKVETAEVYAVKPVPGRLQKVNTAKNVFVDYAHTPAALENVLSTLKQLQTGRIITVFGAGGNRDVSKRPLMYKAANKFSDFCLITNDNPRWEDPEQIIQDIISETAPEDNFWILPDRKKAIKTAIALAKPQDIVLIAGKGHENYQEIKGKKLYFSDVEIAEQNIKSPSTSLLIPIHTLFLQKLFHCKLPSQYLNAISTDSRKIEPNSLFIALEGENYDGHDYIENVLSVPNCLAVVKKDFPSNDIRLIKVKSPLAAMGKLAKKYLALFNLTKIALTGSVGKTTCKEFIYNILSESAPTQKTCANENNQIGLPRTIFRMKPETQYAILELGTNHFGEIEYLTQIAQPDIGIITKIGATHLEFLKSIEGVFQEKSALLRFPLKLRIFPGDDNRFSEFEGVTFGKNADNDFQIGKIESKGDKTIFWLNKEKYQINSPFTVHACNAAIAVILAKKLKIEDKIIRRGLAKPLQVNYRMQILQISGQIYLADCYNANPDSMQAAIEFWQNYLPHRPHVAILGDMLELGKYSDKHHKEISAKMKNEKFDSFISIGKYATLYEADMHFDSVNEFLQADIKFPPEAVILLKASHSLGLEKIVERK